MLEFAIVVPFIFGVILFVELVIYLAHLDFIVPLRAVKALWNSPVPAAAGPSRADAETALRKASTDAGKVCHVLFWIAVASTAVGIVTVLVAIAPFVTGTATKAARAYAQQALFTQSGASRLPGLLEVALSAGCLFCLARFFAGVAVTARPFELARAAEVKRVALILLVLGIVPGPLGNALAYGAARLAGLSFSFDALGSVSIPFITIGVLVAALARVFEYGCVLQDQDDRLF